MTSSSRTSRQDDPAFPALHIRPPRGWVNDPNGVAKVDGTYHVFFQHNPRSPVHDVIAWGHARSGDLLHWQEEPLALRPRPGGPDSHGCWTGCVVDDDGVPTAVYSAVTDDSGAAQVVLARSDRRMRSWAQDARPVLGVPDDGTVTDVRDPFVFTHQGRRYAVQGAGHRQGLPRLLLYGCDDLTRWTELGTLLRGDHPVARHAAANVWECPNLVPIGDRWLLVVSLWRWVEGTHALCGVRYLLGDLHGEQDTLRFEPTSVGVLDHGPAFYAPQLLVDGDRVLLWAWSWEHGRDEVQVRRAGWAGVLTFPREVALDGAEGVRSQPARELDRLRREVLAAGPGGEVGAWAFEVEARGAVELLLDGGDGLVPVVRAEGSAQRPARVLVDGSLVEAFSGTPGGRSQTTRAYPTRTSTWVVRVDGGSEAVVHRLGLPAAAAAGQAGGRSPGA